MYDYCRDLDLGGITEWRLPELNELHSIVVLERTIQQLTKIIFLIILQVVIGLII